MAYCSTGQQHDGSKINAKLLYVYGGVLAIDQLLMIGQLSNEHPKSKSLHNEFCHSIYTDTVF